MSLAVQVWQVFVSRENTSQKTYSVEIPTTLDKRFKNIVRQPNSMDYSKGLEGDSVNDNWKKDDDDIENKDIRSEKVIDIVRGNYFENNDDRSLKTSLAIIYTLGKYQNPVSLSFLDKKSDYIAKGTVSGKNYLEKMEQDNILNTGENEEEYEISLTELGEEIFSNIRSLFEGLKDVNKVEKSILQFRDLYLRNPSVKELSNMLDRPVDEEEIHKTSLNWEKEGYKEGKPEEIAFQLAIGYVICQTSAEDSLGVLGKQYPGQEIPVIGFSDTIQESYSRSIQEIPDYNKYAQTNEDFLRNFDLYHNGGEIFRLVFDDFTKFVINKEELEFEVKPEEVKEKLKDVAENSTF